MTVATLFASAWDSAGHGHDLTAAADAAWCALDHEAEGGAAASSRTTVSEAAPLHEHSCVACKLGRSQSSVEHAKSIAAAPDRISTRATAATVDPRNGESWQRIARGPPGS